MRALSSLILVAVVLACAGCGGGGGSSSTTNAPTPYSSQYMVVNLSNGSALATAADPGVSNTAVAFVRLSPTLYVGIHPVTQKQWTAVLGTTPWTAVPTAVSAPVTADAAPAYNISYDEAAEYAVALSNQSGLRIQLISESQWRTAVGAAEYPWGASLAVTDIAANAWVNESRSIAGPTTVGGRAPSATGIYDLVGNVREWTQEQTLVGGSWADNVIVCGKSKFMSSVASVDASARHPLCGVRLVAIP